MDVILDSNILIADPWLRSARLSVLKDYVAKTRGQIVLLKPVEEEFRGHVFRSVRTQVEAIQSALKAAGRLGLDGLPEIDADGIIRATTERWETNLQSYFGGWTAKRVEADGSVLPELLKRAAQRLPPVAPNGREVRDTIIWLSALAYLRARKWGGPVAFISSNTQDFAASDGQSLRPDLLPDTTDIKGQLEYFSSLEGFIRAYAAPVQHVSKEWVLARLDMADVRVAVGDKLQLADAERLFKIHSWEFEDYYEPRRVVNTDDIECELDDVYVYEVEEGSITTFLEFSVTGEVLVEADLVRSPPGSEEGYYYSDDYRPERTFSVEAELVAEMDAIIAGDNLLLGAVEEIRRM